MAQDTNFQDDHGSRRPWLKTMTGRPCSGQADSKFHKIYRAVPTRKGYDLQRRIDPLLYPEHALIGGVLLQKPWEANPQRGKIKVGDWLCFHASTIGVVADARVCQAPERKSHPSIKHPDEYPWVVELDSVKMYTDRPVEIDRAIRAQLDAFKGKDPEKTWGWFVLKLTRIDKHDFDLLTRRTD